ncbi:MAG TPA: UDP-N-acetylmuramoyl-tripeptide--D-alanyl-D-alanine ligase [Candidatus Baltobacteraceae bacterium]|nr:UDP-N-acetylmuramoyl-tripeptide--D-alanyl-D-alanine ligase [Candidatus Baltobacteraceae bacterium]
MKISRDDALAAAGGEAFDVAALPAFWEFSTDSRTLQPGQVFVALRGATFDGHAFVPEALARGAAALVVDDRSALPEGTPALAVRDTTLALLAFGGVARAQSRAKVVAITGSAGKTTTKALLAQLLEHTGFGTVAATVANENNEIGVAKLLLGVPGDAAAIVAELGARHFGEIETLVRAVRPDVGILTNVGDAHLEIMGSPERLAETKWGLFATGAQAVLNLDDATSRARAAGLRPNPEWFGARERVPDEQLPGGRETLIVGRRRLVVRGPSGVASFAVDCRLAGAHNLSNLAAAAAGALALGVPPEQVAAAAGELALPAGRYERLRIGEIELIYDAYNASMSGTLATLGSFALESGGRRIAVLGGMAELGPQAAAMHERVGAAAAECGLALLLLGGEFANDFERGARAAGFPPERLLTFRANGEAIALLRERARPGDLVLLKGSRKYKLEEIREGLRAVYA